LSVVDLARPAEALDYEALTAHRSPLTAHRSPLTAHRSPLTAHLTGVMLDDVYRHVVEPELL